MAEITSVPVVGEQTQQATVEMKVIRAVDNPLSKAVAAKTGYKLEENVITDGESTHPLSRVVAHEIRRRSANGDQG